MQNLKSVAQKRLSYEYFCTYRVSPRPFEMGWGKLAKDAAKRRAFSKLKVEAIAQDRRALFQAHIRGRHLQEKVGALWI